MIKQLELEIEELVKKAEEADCGNNDNGLSIPEEIKRRENRVEALKTARKIIEERFEETRAEKKPNMRKKWPDVKRLREVGKSRAGKNLSLLQRVRKKKHSTILLVLKAKL
jgi:hypothetical protein